MTKDAFDPQSSLAENLINDTSPSGEYQHQRALSEDEQEMQDLFQLMRLGDNMRLFLATDLGTRLRDRARDEVMNNAIEMLDVDVTDTTKMRQLQSRAGAARFVFKFIEETLAEGDQAYEAFQASQPS